MTDRRSFSYAGDGHPDDDILFRHPEMALEGANRVDDDQATAENDPRERSYTTTATTRPPTTSTTRNVNRTIHLDLRNVANQINLPVRMLERALSNATSTTATSPTAQGGRTYSVMSVRPNNNSQQEGFKPSTSPVASLASIASRMLSSTNSSLAGAFRRSFAHGRRYRAATAPASDGTASANNSLTNMTPFIDHNNDTLTDDWYAGNGGGRLGEGRRAFSVSATTTTRARGVSNMIPLSGSHTMISAAASESLVQTDGDDHHDGETIASFDDDSAYTYNGTVTMYANDADDVRFEDHNNNTSHSPRMRLTQLTLALQDPTERTQLAIARAKQDQSARRRVAFAPQVVTSVVVVEDPNAGDSGNTLMLKITLALPWLTWVALLFSTIGYATSTLLARRAYDGDMDKAGLVAVWTSFSSFLYSLVWVAILYVNFNINSWLTRRAKVARRRRRREENRVASSEDDDDDTDDSDDDDAHHQQHVNEHADDDDDNEDDETVHNYFSSPYERERRRRRREKRAKARLPPGYVPPPSAIRVKRRPYARSCLILLVLSFSVLKLATSRGRTERSVTAYSMIPFTLAPLLFMLVRFIRRWALYMSEIIGALCSCVAVSAVYVDLEERDKSELFSHNTAVILATCLPLSIAACAMLGTCRRVRLSFHPTTSIPIFFFSVAVIAVVVHLIFDGTGDAGIGWIDGWWTDWGVHVVGITSVATIQMLLLCALYLDVVTMGVSVSIATFISFIAENKFNGFGSVVSISVLVGGAACAAIGYILIIIGARQRRHVRVKLETKSRLYKQACRYPQQKAKDQDEVDDGVAVPPSDESPGQSKKTRKTTTTKSKRNETPPTVLAAPRGHSGSLKITIPSIQGKQK
eukprot:PhM_4_TR10871/c0_g1_i1/m.15953